MTLGDVSVRRLAPGDLDAVVAIDAVLSGRSRRAYFDRRLRAAVAHPEAHVQWAVDDDGGLAGYVLARRLSGEFGRDEAALRVEVLGVRTDVQHRGAGQALVTALDRWATAHGVTEMRTQASWRAHDLLRFLDRVGFELAPHLVVDCEIAVASRRFERRSAEAQSALEFAPVRLETDYGTQPGGEMGVTRDAIVVRALRADDVHDVSRMDRKRTGHERDGYIAAAVREAMENSAVRVSLVAEIKGVPVGFVMARTDVGDYGRSEPVAVLDTLGVDPGWARRGVGDALLTQLFFNLGGLRIERVESVVSRADFGLLGFLYHLGFDHSPRLQLVRAVRG